MAPKYHDLAGVDTDFVDFSDYDDGYGNNICYGDTSVLEMVECGSRDPHRWKEKEVRPVEFTKPALGPKGGK